MLVMLSVLPQTIVHLLLVCLFSFLLQYLRDVAFTSVVLHLGTLRQVDFTLSHCDKDLFLLGHGSKGKAKIGILGECARHTVANIHCPIRQRNALVQLALVHHPMHTCTSAGMCSRLGRRHHFWSLVPAALLVATLTVS